MSEGGKASLRLRECHTFGFGFGFFTLIASCQVSAFESFESSEDPRVDRRTDGGCKKIKLKRKKIKRDREREKRESSTSEKREGASART